MNRNDIFFDKLEKETFELMQFKEHLVENNLKAMKLNISKIHKFLD